MSYVINNEINIQLSVQGAGEAASLAQNINILVDNTQNLAKAQANAGTGTTSMRYALRRLAVDMRMVAVGMRVVGAEFGAASPVIAAFTNSVYLTTSALVSLIAVINVQQSWNSIVTNAQATGTALTGLNAVIQKVATSSHLLVYALAAIAAVMVISWIYDQITGLSKMKDALKNTEDAIWQLNDRMQSLRITQAQLSEGTNMYSYRVQALELEIERQGYATEGQIMLLKSLQAEYKSAGLEAAYLNLEAGRYQTTLLELNQIKSRTQYDIDNVNRDLVNRIQGGYQGAANIPIPPPKSQLGGEVNRSGAINVEAGEVVMQKEQLATMLQGRGGGNISLTISLAGANINGVDDLEGSIARGGERAREEIQKLRMLRDNR